jgi:hypothetical protein
MYLWENCQMIRSKQSRQFIELHIDFVQQGSTCLKKLQAEKNGATQ